MVVLKQENSCRFCPKVFCCTDCREAHESKNHPKPKCSICVKRPLPFKPNSAEDSDTKSKLHNHIISDHLPLHCKLCGDTFYSSQDLDAAEPCKFWERRRARKQQELTPHVINELSKEDPSLIAEQKLPATPKFIPDPSIKSSLLIDSAPRIKHQDNNFDSPPELARQTSTPMHGIGASHHQKLLQVNAASIPQFLLKTPSSFDATGSACSSVGSRGSSGYSGTYYTGIDDPMARLSIGSVNSNKANTGDYQSADPCWSTTPSYLLSRKRINPNITVSERKERSIMKPDALERISRLGNNDSSIEKRVRFSDQCVVPASLAASDSRDLAETSAYYADNEIFFEAREELEEPEDREGAVALMKKTEMQTSCSCCCRKGDVSSSSTTVCDGSNNNNNNNEKKVENAPADSSVDGNKSTGSTSSRMLMMLLVEKTDSKGLSSLDLAPLIDSGLKKLEESVASANNSASIIVKGSHECIAEASHLSRKPNHHSNHLEHPKTSTPTLLGSHSRAVSIRDSFVSISSDRVECFSSNTAAAVAAASKQSQEVEEQLLADKAAAAPAAAADEAGGTGIFSVVARVVRSALKKLPDLTAVGGVATRNLSREPLSQITCPISNLSSSTSSLSISSSEVLSVGPARAAVSTSQILLQRSASKRPREQHLDSGEEPIRNHSPGSSVPRCDVISSPAAKRYRGRYRIKAREPIARMRERHQQVPVSPRGASRETQRFQQGALSIGDTFLPLPSRAHQSTQTED